MPGAVNVSSPGVQITNNGVEIADGTAVRATIGQLTPAIPAIGATPAVAPTYGLRVVSSNGTTVIIDGTSDMFKIAATGTLTLAFPVAPTFVLTNVTLSALGSGYTVVPMMQVTVTFDNSSGSTLRSGHYQLNMTATTMNYLVSCQCLLSAGTPVVTLQAFSNSTNPGTTAACRYYVLEETAV